jgi:hypothetical protein
MLRLSINWKSIEKTTFWFNTRENALRQLTADSDSNSLLGVLTVVVGLSQSQIISTISYFSSDNQNNHT